jgi:hypothetical protein
MPGAFDDMAVALFAYDDCAEVLKLVLSEPWSKSYADYFVPLNEGVVGAAFKRAAPVCYVHPELSGSHDDAAYLYDRTLDLKEMGRWRYLIALPIFASVEPFRIDVDSVTHGWLSSATVGVITLSSESPASGLARIALGSPTRSSAEEDLQSPEAASEPVGSAPDYNQIWAYAHVLLAILEEPTGEIPEPLLAPAGARRRETRSQIASVSEESIQGVDG